MTVNIDIKASSPPERCIEPECQKRALPGEMLCREHLEAFERTALLCDADGRISVGNARLNIASHTPGPYHKKLSVRAERDYGIFSERNELLAEVYEIIDKTSDGYIRGPSEANACLFAAAAELLELLLRCEYWLSVHPDGREMQLAIQSKLKELKLLTDQSQVAP